MDELTPRARAARETRRRVVTAATASFLERGFPATTIREVAQGAGVSQETVYKSFRGKAGLLKAAYDVTLAGDDDERPIADRPESRAVGEARSPTTSAAAYAELARTLNRRAGPLLRTVLAARGASAEVDEFAAIIDAERLVGAGMTVDHWVAQGWLREDLSAERARDILWMLTSPAVLQLAHDRGWTEAELCSWLVRTILDQVLVPTP